MKKYVLLLILICRPAFGADVKWTAISELTAINDADILVVVDDVAGTPISKKITVLNFFDTIDSSSKLRAIVTDETGTGVLVFGTAPTFTTSITITGADADPAAAGEIRYDNTITGIMSGGALRWYDDNSVRLLVDLETDPSNDDYVVAYDSTADGFYMKADADTGGSTKWNAIGDADGVGSIDFVTYAQTIDIGATDTGGPKSGLILDVTGLGAGTTDIIALEITTATDDDTDYIPIAVYDDSGVANDLLFQVNSAGAVLAEGGVTLSDGATVTQSANNYVTITENSDTFQVLFNGTNVVLLYSDGSLIMRNAEDGIDGTVVIAGKDAGEKGVLQVSSDGDDKLIQLTHDDTDAQISSSSGDIYFTSAGGDINFNDDNLITTGTAATGVLTVTGVINTSVGIDGVGAVDFDIGSGDVTDVTITENGGTYIFDNGLTAVGEDLGSATAEWNDLFLNDGGVIKLGNDQDVTITHVADTGIQMELDDSIMFGDTAVFIESDDDGFLDLDADTGIRLNGTVTSTGTVTATGSFIIGSADLNETDMEKLDGITNGTAAANKALVLGASGEIATITTATITTATITNNIKSEPKHLVFTIINPLATQTEDNEICLWKAVPASLTVTKIEVTLDASGNEVAGDLKWADAFIGLANATVINVFDTTSGVLVDSTITAGSVASGKCMYLAFDSAPNTAITQMSVDITFDYD